MQIEISWGQSADQRGLLVAPDPVRPKTVVLLCHGLLSSRDSATNRTLADRLLPHNVATLRFDFVGHGSCADPDDPLAPFTLTRCLEQTRGALSWLKEQGATRIGIVGSSFGGLVALQTAARHPDIVAVGLKCPVVDYPPLWQARLGEGGMRHWQGSGRLVFATHTGRASLPYRFYDDLLSHKTAPAAMIASPVLIVHGDADEDVPVEQSRELFRHLQSPKELVVLPGADHEFSNPADFEKMIDLLVAGMIGRVSGRRG